MNNKDERRDPNEVEQLELECGEPGRDEEAHVQLQIEAAKQRTELAQSHPEDTSLPRIGVYICRCGGNISDVVDVERVAETARLIPGVAIAKVHTFVCSDPGQ